MTSKSIYISVLLPDIIDYCQVFFPSLIEQSQRQHPSTSCPSDIEIRNGLNQFMEWLQRCLAPPLTQISDATQRDKGSRDTQELVGLLTQYINLSTDSGVTPDTNPLAQHRILDSLNKVFIINCEEDPSAFTETLEQQFNELSLSFYQQLNRFCGCYFSMSTSTHTQDIPKPNICLDSNLHFRTPEAAAPSLSDAEGAIQYVQQFIDAELNLDKVDALFHSLGKKISIPIINYALANPDALLSPETQHPLKQLLVDIKTIAQHCRENKTPTSYRLSTQAEITLKHFIAATMEGSEKLNETLFKLAPLVQQCTAHTQTPSNKAPLSKKPKDITQDDIKPKKVIHQPQAIPPLVSIRTPTPQPVKKQTEKIKKTKHTAFSSIREQASHMVKTLLLDCDSQNSLAAKLQNEWQKMLEFIGNHYGVRSQQWDQAIGCFITLTHYASINALPLQQAKDIEKQLRLAGIRSPLISKRTQAPPIEAQYAAILKEGNWFYYQKDEQQTRCKLAAIIKQIGRYIFISRQGQKVLEIDYSELKKQLVSGQITPCSRASLNNTLEDVLSNIKHAQTKEFELDY
jgi:hypothetical protein